MSPRRRIPPPGLLLLAACALLAGCGGGSGEAPGVPATVTPEPAGAPEAGGEPPERHGPPTTELPTPTLSPSGDGGRTLVLAVDGLEWRVILPMAREGHLPHLAGLMGRGRYGKLETLTPTISQILWTSAATGKLPAKHGITTLLKETDGRRGARLYSSADRMAKAVWNIFSDGGLTSRTVGWWKAYPAERVRGVMVPQLNLLYSFDESGLGIFRPERAGTLEDLVQPVTFRPFVERTAREAEAGVTALAESIFGRFRHKHSPFGSYALPRMRWVLGMDEMHRRIALELLRQGKPWQLTMVYLRGADVLSHAFWRFTWPAGYADPPTREERENYGGLVPKYYRHMDTVVGELAAAAGPETTIIVLSDHGMEAGHREASFTPGGPVPPESKSGDHETGPPGIFIAAGPGIASRGEEGGLQIPAWEDLETAGSIMDLAPLLLALAGLPVGEDMDGRVPQGLLDPVFLESHPLGTIATHDTPGWRERDAGYRFSEEEVQERLEELRSIGYLE